MQSKVIKAVIWAAAITIFAQSCTPVILPKRGCPTNQGLIGYR